MMANIHIHIYIYTYNIYVYLNTNHGLDMYTHIHTNMCICIHIHMSETQLDAILKTRSPASERRKNPFPCSSMVPRGSRYLTVKALWHKTHITYMHMYT